MARLTKHCVLCNGPQPVRLELQPGSAGGTVRYVATCLTCNTPMPADGPVLTPDQVTTWLAQWRAKEAQP